MEAKSFAELYNISDIAVLICKNDSGAILNLRPFTSSVIYCRPYNNSNGNEFPSPALNNK